MRSPDGGQDEAEYTACHLINDHEGSGFVRIDFARIAASYDAKKGLLITFPFGLYVDGMKPNKPGTAKIRLNLKAGTVTAEK